ncbi:MAG: malectin domain-containing carbohydrate-binding protein [Phycisphaerae bacterium]
MLKKYSDPSDWMAGPTAYALTIRGIRERTDEEAFSILCFRLGRSPHPFERMMIANRLWSDYGAKAEWAIYEAAKAETDPFVKLDLLYYVSRTKNVELARAAVASDWSACFKITGDYAYFLALITPGRTARYEHTLPSDMVKALARTAEAAPADAPPCTIVVPKGASYAETLAAKEVRRYVYLRTARLLPIVEGVKTLPEGGDLIVVATEDRRLPGDITDASRFKGQKVLPQQYLLETIRQGNRRVLLVVGSDDAGVLYAAYRFAEHLGVRFYLEGDVVPDAKIPFTLPDLSEIGKPLFETRGIQPFHDFPEGPDWWNLDDYKAYISQLVKLRMNFFGLHTYPEGNPNAEPAVWIGLPQDIGEGTKVKFSYPASWQNTLRGNWGYNAKKTSEFSFGAADLFDRDDFGADVMRGFCPQPQTPEASNDLFDRSGAMLAEAFKHARRLGVKTCVGTETPLTIPKAVQEHLKALGKDPKDKAVVQELYEGIFKRIAQTYQADYYWFWTPEGWTWGSVKPEQVQATQADLAAAVAAAKKVQAPFTLATCGWVLGPQNDRALFDKTLPKNMPMSCINREVGKSFVEPGFAKVEGRPKWAIPWMEDDPNLCSVQLWVGRMRKDAADALKYGCTGLLGIHWRTRVLGPNVSALAQAAWDQSGWNKPVAAPPPDRKEGPEGGQVAAFPQNTIAGTDDPALYQTVRYNLSAYHFNLPPGKYAVRLQFCEPYYKEAGKRVFGVRIQDKQVIENLDIFAKVGQNKALDCTFKDVEVRDGGLDIEFVPETEFPSIAAIAVEGPGGTKKVNCGGPAYKDYAADPPVAGPDTPKDRFLPTADFYRDWALHQFGPEVAEQAAVIFEKIDGCTPEPTTWVDGPGGIRPNNKPVDEVLKAYAFVGDLEKLRPQVQGAGHQERFDYWLENFRYMMAIERLKCAWAKKDEAAMKQALADLHRHLLATVTTPGELGTVANWQQHNLPRLNLTDLEMAYRGPVRVIVPTVRTTLDAGEPLILRVIILAEKPPTAAHVFVRPLGKGEFTRVPLAHVARGVYSARIAPPGGEDFEYYVEAAPAEGNAARWPVTAPGTCQTVVVTN